MNTDILEKNNGTADAWLNAAYEMLTQRGVDAVKIMALANHLHVTRTSFYWHFDSRASLLEALIQQWEAKNTGNLVKQTEKRAQTICAAILNLFDCWVDKTLFDAELDLAIRNWARNDVALQARLDKADTTRINAIAKMFERFGYSPTQAETRSRTIIYTQIGYFFMQVSEDQVSRFARMPDYIEVFTDHSPTEAEIAEFMQRHQL